MAKLDKKQPKLTKLDDIKTLSSEDFMNLGVNHVFYIKPMALEGDVTGYAVHAADGTTLAIEESFDLAANVIADQDMSAVSVH